MARIVFIGAGSMGFTRALSKDILSFPLLKDSTLVLMDIDKDRLDFSRKAVQAIVEKGKYPAKVIATTDRKEALKGADAVISTIFAGGVKTWIADFEIPGKYGISQAVGDTRGPGGVFRALRTIPVMVDICRDMERLCPDAIFLNYTNPMAMLCRAMQKSSFIKVTGLCHSVQGTAGILANWIGAKMDQITYVCAGINHQAWYIEYKKDGKDAYPLIRKAANKKENYGSDKVRIEMLNHLGYYVTESSGHNSEYNWWFRKRPDLIEKYLGSGGGDNIGRFLKKNDHILKKYLWSNGTWKRIVKNWCGYGSSEVLRKRILRQKTWEGFMGQFASPDVPESLKRILWLEVKGKAWKDFIKQWLDHGEDIILERGHEYAAYIINAVQGGDPFKFNGNVPNKGIISNLPPEVCVEVPVLANKRGFNSIYVGELPPQCAALNNVNIAVEEMAVEAALTGDPVLACRALYFDPLTASLLSLAEIKKMVQEMLEKNKDYLPQFKSIKI